MPAPVLVLGSVVGIQAGHACGKLLFGLVAPMGVVALRLAFAAVVLVVLWRPRWPADRRSLGLVLGWGTAIAGMNGIYLAFDRLPIGAAVTMQFLGPLAVALAGSRSRRDVGWAALAGLGVLLFHRPGGAGLSVSGTLLALGSGAAWAAYILLTRHQGTRHAGGSELALAVAWAALLVAPLGVLQGGTQLATPAVLLGGLGVAVLSAVVPWSLDLAALRRMQSHTFGVLLSLEPAFAGLAGLVLLGEDLAPSQWLAAACVVTASMGVAWSGRAGTPRS